MIIYLDKRSQMQSQSKRKPLHKSQDDNIQMTKQNLKICNKNQDRYNTPQLNDALELHYYGFVNIDNLSQYSNINTLYLNNNVITKMENLGCLTKLVTLNLANNRIAKIDGLEQLQELFILDLSNNKIEKVENLSHLQKLMTLNLSFNMIAQPESISQLKDNKKLTCLNLSNNPLPEDQSLFTYLEQIPLLTLFLKDTKFSRGVPSYRKQTICHLKQLTYLDEKPVTKQQRMMAQAWKQGGLQKQKQVRKLIEQGKEKKNKKIFAQMQARAQKITKKRDELFQKLTHEQHEQLQSYKHRLQQQQVKQPKDHFQIQLILTKIQQLSLYLKLFREDVNYMPVGQTRQVPNNLCERHEHDAIYIYGVSQQQLPKIKQTYYPDETRPLIARDFEKPTQLRWLPDYEQILHNVCHEYIKKSQFILPKFNIKVHEFDEKYQRKARRFKQSQVDVHEKIKQFAKVDAEEEASQQHQMQNVLNDLD